MSILIRGMGMPDKCGHCRFANAFDCTVTGSFISTHSIRQPDCPLVHVPEHGDLIDKSGVDVLSWHEKDEGDFKDGVLFVLDKIDELPVIIPADTVLQN